VKRFAICALAFFLGGWAATQAAKSSQAQPDAHMGLGNFSVSLNVKDVAASRTFYEKLGFRKVFGDPAQKFVIMQNDSSTIGLFHGEFDKNTMTFNPGWNRNMEQLSDFDDVRAIQRTLKSRGVPLTSEADETSAGPAAVTLVDPDGNPILIDQHVPAPKK
jgi:catechol 2,3-dioxygenase-like lactoylglutathione lyase family enzyme